MIRGGGGGEKVVKSGRVIHAGVIKRVISRHAPRNPRNRLNDPPSSIPLVISRFTRDAEFADRAIFRLFRNEKTNFFERPHRMMKRMENLVFKSLFQHLSLRGLIGPVS